MSEPSSSNLTEGMERRKAGYYRWADVVWTWPGTLAPYDRNAITAMVHPRPLTERDHPLRESGKEGVELYVGTQCDGCQMLCFSLRQIEYVVEYIHKARLNDPAWLEYVAACRGSAKEVPPCPPLNPAILPPPLPNTLVPAEAFVKVEPVLATSHNVKKLNGAIRKYNRALAQSKLDGSTPVTPLATPKVDLEPMLPSPEVEDATTPEDEPDTVISEQLLEEIQEGMKGQLEAIAKTAATPPNPANYFDLVQQAIFTAAHGGAFRALQLKMPAGWNNSNLGEYLIPAVGRSLFIVMEMRADPGDPTTVIDFGYAALWYELNPNQPDDFIAQHDRGHWIAQESRAAGTETAPYMFGKTVYHARAALRSAVIRKLIQLSQLAGKGPMYIVNHSRESDYSTLDALGLNTGLWFRELDPVIWDYPGHITPEAIGQRILIDIAVLWAAVEADQPGNKVEGGVSTRTLNEITTLLSPDDDELDIATNSGNKAMLAFTLFDNIVNRRLEELRDTVHLALVRDELMRTVGKPKSEDIPETLDAEPEDKSEPAEQKPREKSDGKIEDKARDETGIITETSHTAGENGDHTLASGDESEDDSDFEGVGIYYTNDEGELVQMDDD